MNSATQIKERTYIRKRFTLVIPATIRTQLQLREDDPVDVTLQGKNIIITPIRDDPFDNLTIYGKDIVFNRETRKLAEKLLINMVNQDKEN